MNPPTKAETVRTALIDDYDAALFDLDGVVYLGPHAVVGARDAMEALRQLGKRVLYVTNNAARPAHVVVDQLNRLGISTDLDSVLTSAQVAASALVEELPQGAKVLVSGSENLANLLTEAGFRVVPSADDRPIAVVQGYDPDLSWRRLDEAALAIQGGARWYATNSDASRPTDRGLVPGVGGAIAVLATALGGGPTIFGKPYRPMLEEAIRRTAARRPIFVGDRLDTDIVGAVSAGIDSMLVLSGAHGKHDLVAAPAEAHPSCIGADVSALLAPRRTAETDGSRASCGEQRAVAVDGVVHLQTSADTRDEQLDALWAIAQLAWRDPSRSTASVLDLLTLLS